MSAIKSIVDPTQNISSNELLELCSGRFDQSQNLSSHVIERRRHPSDGSMQGVRELLGLPLQSKPPSILKLLDQDGENSLMKEDSQTSSEMNEVIGLCSGVFPTTQASQGIKKSLDIVPGVRDGSQSRKDEITVFDHTIGDEAVLRWAERQRKLQFKGHSKSGREEDESDDEDMPVIRRRRVKLKPRSTKE